MTSSTFWSQDLFKYSDTLNKTRRNIVFGTEIVGAGSSLFLLNEVWYKNYPRVTFQTFNDNDEWLQMDKAGHMMTSYYAGLAGIETLKWAGCNQKTSAILGGSLGLMYLTGVEILDGTSAQWGFSWGDMAANAAGTILAGGQELLWQEQRIKFKVSAHLTDYAAQRPNLLGATTAERLLKDYNGQTYWASCNLQSLFFRQNEKFPKWINLAIGYSAKDMISGTEGAQFCIDNPALCGQYSRYRQFLISADLDLTKIQWKSKFMKTLFGSIGWIKFPAPTLVFDKNGAQFRPVYF